MHNMRLTFRMVIWKNLLKSKTVNKGISLAKSNKITKKIRSAKEVRKALKMIRFYPFMTRKLISSDLWKLLANILSNQFAMIF